VTKVVSVFVRIFVRRFQEMVKLVYVSTDADDVNGDSSVRFHHLPYRSLTLVLAPDGRSVQSR
jgi:hypothetical protein